MPGIAGLFSRRAADECRHVVAEMTASMSREPFYVSGTADCAELGIYGGWVAHPDSYAARHSGASPTGIQMLLAGECVADGGAPDIPALYEEDRTRFVSKLNGLFSGLLIDGERRRAMLFNDRYGIERLYVHQKQDELYFGSDPRALLRVLPELRTLDDEAVAQFLAFGCTHDWRTIFHGVELTGAGTLWAIEPGSVRRSQYFVPSAWEGQAPLSEHEFDGVFQETFRRILPRYLSGGPAVGISLTGGLDTRMIMACLSDASRVAACYTFSGEQDWLLDERIAAQVAAVHGIPHKVLRIGPDFVDSYPTLVDKTIEATGGTLGATGAHEIYFNELARHLAPVRLTGNFGSEVLRSMSTFKPVGLSGGLLADGVAETVRGLIARPATPAVHPVTFAAFKEVPWGLFGSLAAGRSQVTFRTPYLDNDLVALAYRAPAALRQSPHSSLRLISGSHPALAAIPTDRGVLHGDSGAGRLGRRLFSEVTFKLDYLDKEGLPSWLAPAAPLFGLLSKTRLLGLHKYLPYRRWFREELAPYIRDVVTDPRTARLPYWNREALEAMVINHVRGRRNHVRDINAVLTLEAVHRLLLRSVPAPPVIPEAANSR